MLIKSSNLYEIQPSDIKKQLFILEKKIKEGRTSKDELTKMLYWRKPPTPQEYLSEAYIGTLVHMLYPKWKDVFLKDIFNKGSIVNEVILGGAIGVGKSTLGMLSQFYNLIKIISYRCPQYIYGVPETTILATIFISLTKDKAQMVLLGKLISFLSNTDLFYEAKKKSFNIDKYVMSEKDKRIPYILDVATGGSVIKFPNRVWVYAGSSIGHAMSMDLIGALLDEAEFRRGGMGEALDLYSTVKERIRNRFLDMRNILLCLISSARTEGGIMTNYIGSLEPNDQKIRIYSFPVWEVKQFDSYKKGSFHVLAGNKRNPSRILSDKEAVIMSKGKPPKDCFLMKVPLSHKHEFETNLVRALRNLAGFSTSEYEDLVDDFYCFINYDKTLLPELDIKASLHSSIRLIVYVKELFKTIPGVKEILKRAPNAKRYIHMDLAETTEGGLCMLHKEIDKNGRIKFVVDFIMKLTSSDRIDIEKIQDLIEDLSVTYNVNFASITGDQFQSAQILQYCTKHNFADFVGIQSVVRDIEPYLTYARIINKRQLAIGDAPTLFSQTQAMGLDLNNELMTSKRKDMADAICGAIFKASQNIGDEPDIDIFYDVLSQIKNINEAEKINKTTVNTELIDIEEI